MTTIQNPHNVGQRRAKLEREIAHLKETLAMLPMNPVTKLGKRAQALAVKCLRQRERDIAKLNQESE